MKNILLFFLKIYQKFFTLLSFGSCRYYPTCSEYARLQIEYNSLTNAFFTTIIRLTRCNRLFDGGFDYPKIKYNRINKGNFVFKSHVKCKILVWFVPANLETFYVVKSF